MILVNLAVNKHVAIICLFLFVEMRRISAYVISLSNDLYLIINFYKQLDIVTRIKNA